MKYTALLFAAVLLFIGCTKDDEVEPTPVPDPSYVLWTIPRDTTSIEITLNGVPVVMDTSKYYPYQGYLPSELRTVVVNGSNVYTTLIYKVDLTVVPNDIIRVSSTGMHEVMVGTSTMAITSSDTTEFVVWGN